MSTEPACDGSGQAAESELEFPNLIIEEVEVCDFATLDVERDEAERDDAARSARRGNRQRKGGARPGGGV